MNLRPPPGRWARATGPGRRPGPGVPGSTLPWRRGYGDQLASLEVASPRLPPGSIWILIFHRPRSQAARKHAGGVARLEEQLARAPLARWGRTPGLRAAGTMGQAPWRAEWSPEPTSLAARPSLPGGPVSLPALGRQPWLHRASNTSVLPLVFSAGGARLPEARDGGSVDPRKCWFERLESWPGSQQLDTPACLSVYVSMTSSSHSPAPSPSPVHWLGRWQTL